MKNFLKHKAAIVLGALALVLASCSSEDPVSSKVTNYAVLTMAGDRITVINEGDTFTDQGVTATENGEDVEVTSEGTVDTSTPGVYDIYYTAVNQDGFAAEARRIVIVLESDPSAINLEGTFYRNGNPNIITRLGDRVYRADNAGGLAVATSDDAANKLNVIFYNIDDQHVYVPYQENASQSGLSVESNIGTIVNQNNFSWVLFASGYYGTAVRTFTR